MLSTNMQAGPSTRSELLARWRTQPPSLARIILGLVVVALILRLWELGARPLHHDESLDAWWSWLFRNGDYKEYDPVYHGPLRFYITAGLFQLFGESEAVVRLFSALCGTAVVGLPWFLRRELGRAGTIAAAVALCISPTMLYYSRFGREDAQMVFLTLLSLVLGLAYLHRPRIVTATALAFVLACSFAIKESTYLFGLLLAVYALVVVAAQFDAQNKAASGVRPDPDRLDPPFFSSALAFAAIGLLLAVVVGAASDELFVVLALFGAALAAFVLAAALPALRSADFQWPAIHASIWIASATIVAAMIVVMRRFGSDSAPTPETAWRVSVFALALGAIVALGGTVVLLSSQLASGLRIEPISGTTTPMARAYATAGLVCGLALLANEYLEVESSRTTATVAIAIATFGFATLVAFAPRSSNPHFEWPPILRSVGAIGWFGWSIALAVFAITWFLYFSVFGKVKQDWASGFTRAITYWDSQQEVNRGGQPWYYYLYALPAYEWLFVVLAFVGSWRVLRRPTVMSGLFVWFSVGSLILYSYAGERMPWLIAHPLLPILVLAGFGVQHLWQHRTHGAMPAIAAALALGLILTTGTSIRASFPGGADSRQILSQAGQATPHLTAALERLDNIDRISRQQTGVGATLAIGTANAWPYNWYLRDRENVVWFSSEDGPPTDGTADVIIVDFRTIDPADFVDYQATLFAMRSWWVPTYTQAGLMDWLGWARGLELWDQTPNPDFSGVSEPDDGEPEPGFWTGPKRVQDGTDATARDWLSFVAADDDYVAPRPDPDTFVEAQDGCGSLDQWFLVHNDFAFTESQVYPGPIADMGPLDCASDLLATS